MTSVANFSDYITWKFQIGQLVEKQRGARWRGRVVGIYYTALTPRGYCVESSFEPGSVQIYPEDALKIWTNNDNI